MKILNGADTQVAIFGVTATGKRKVIRNWMDNGIDIYAELESYWNANRDIVRIVVDIALPINQHNRPIIIDIGD